jgi:effector-binding domain-containing protein
VIDTPQIVQTAAQPVALIHLTIPKADIQKMMGPGIGELRTVVAGQGVAITGPWFTHHLKMDPDTWDFEICLPVASAVTPSGRVKPGRLRAARVARTVYHGSYESLGAGWGEFMQWIEANGHAPAPDLWECYAAGPESGPDPARWRTELNRPLL